jgi:UDPglucose 6-dehydrogenase
MRISIIGTGYVGLVSGTCFAELGHDVTCIDISEEKINMLKNCKSPIYEPGLTELIERNYHEKRLFFSTSYDSVKEAAATFIAVGTPSGDDGKAEMKYVYASIESIIPFLNEDSIVVLKSTVPVGTCMEVEKFIQEKTDKKIHVVNNPEFLKEGTAVNDFMKPSRIIIGVKDDKALAVMEDLYEPLTRAGFALISMTNLSAEMTKYAANCFLATKISFMNEIARLCDVTDADVEEVRKGIGSDPRIGKHFLYPGPGYGGSCFPKDVKALMQTAKEVDLDMMVIDAAEKVNKDQKKVMAQKALKHFDGDIAGKTFALWGTAFKANTDDVRETAAIDTAQLLIEHGAKVQFFDPVAADNYKRDMDRLGLDVTKKESRYEVLDGADALIVITEWKEFRAPDFAEVKSRLKNPIIFDGRNLYNSRKVIEQGFTYYAVGKYIPKH